MCAICCIQSTKRVFGDKKLHVKRVYGHELVAAGATIDIMLVVMVAIITIAGASSMIILVQSQFVSLNHVITTIINSITSKCDDNDNVN